LEKVVFYIITISSLKKLAGPCKSIWDNELKLYNKELPGKKPNFTIINKKVIVQNFSS